MTKTVYELNGIVVFLSLVGVSCSLELRNVTECENTRSSNQSEPKTSFATLKEWESALIIAVGFGGFALLLSLGHFLLRKYIFHDEDRVDTAFDAGGNVTIALIAVSAASQTFWPADLLQSATIATKYGLAGSFWYAVGVVTNVILFPLLSVHFKTRAPGAKTFLQVIYARFGSSAHIVSTFFALVTNMVILTCLILAGTATFTSTAQSMSTELAILLIAFIFGSFSLVGGLGATFYVSYFNTALIYIMLLVITSTVFYLHPEDSIGSLERLHGQLTCVLGPDGNEQRSLLTFRSTGAVIFGVIGIFLASSVTFCDQASWQMRIAAKPLQGVIGFLIAGFIWFIIPLILATTTSMLFHSLSLENGADILTAAQVDEGIVPPAVLHSVMGVWGEVMILSMVCMALMSTGSGEVMAVASIIIYDIYQTYINPFKKDHNIDLCPLCDKPYAQPESPESSVECKCVIPNLCAGCRDDDIMIRESSDSIPHMYGCQTHGKYRQYQDILRRYKTWAILVVTILIVPMGMVIKKTTIDLNWAFQTGTVSSICCFPTVVLSVLWSKTSGAGVIAGNALGLILGWLTMLVTASTYPEGLSTVDNFLKNTVQENSVLVGCCVSFGVSLITCVLISLVTNWRQTQQEAEDVWKLTLAIDNPMYPWTELYKRQLKASEIEFKHRPSFKQMHYMFTKARNTAYAGCSIVLLIILVIIPGSLASFPTMDYSSFYNWITFTHVYLFIMSFFVVLGPPVQEVVKVLRHRKFTLKSKQDLVE
ncbi:unnamed protein product [Owenia fusiformis]|uniref:Uncharacterized protein n=1 Tax=Owenia fusiformis TaxID=6347 RepID=A0A8J1UL42_OWEFU|nr:unnamed protein product [Owenia fusiformis]